MQTTTKDQDQQLQSRKFYSKESLLCASKMDGIGEVQVSGSMSVFSNTILKNYCFTTRGIVGGREQKNVFSD